MKKLALSLSLLLGLSGCATGAYKTSYAAGAITKEFVTVEYNQYSKEFQKRLAVCNPDVNTSVKTYSDLDTCMGRGYRYEDQLKLMQGLATYKAAAELLSAALLQSEADRTLLMSTWAEVLSSALVAVEAFPQGAEKVERLRRLLPFLLRK